MKQIGSLLVVLALSTLWTGCSSMMSVHHDSTDMMKTPDYLGMRIQTLKLGTLLNVVEQQPHWMKTSIPDSCVTGWVHETALVRGKTQMTAGDGDAQLAASAGEASLATKGFTKPIENAYRAKHPEISFKQVDEMEAYTVSIEEIRQFIQSGKLNSTSKGGAE